MVREQLRFLSAGSLQSLLPRQEAQVPRTSDWLWSHTFITLSQNCHTGASKSVPHDAVAANGTRGDRSNAVNVLQRNA